MAHPADTARPGPATFLGGRLTLEEAERLAAAFRPCWDADVAPLSQTIVQAPAVHGAPASRPPGLTGAFADGRVATASSTLALESGHMAHSVPPRAPPPAVTSHDPERSIIVDDSADAEQPFAAPSPARAATLGIGTRTPTTAVPVRPGVQATPAALAPGPAATAPTRPESLPVAPSKTVQLAAARPSVQGWPAVSAAPAEVDAEALDEPILPKRSKREVLIGLAALVVALVIGGIVVTVSSSGSTDKTAAARAATPGAAGSASAAEAPQPPAVAPASQAPIEEQPAHPATHRPAHSGAAPAPPTPVAPTQVSPLAAAPSPPRSSAPARAVLPPRSNYAQAPRTSKRGAQTIVRDVPF